MRLIVTIVTFVSIIQNLECLRNKHARLTFFDIDLLRYAAEDKKGNVMVSPASIKSTLAMLLEGAEGPTANEIRIALRLSPQKEDFREELKLFLQALEVNTTRVLLHNANALFVSQKYRLKKTYQTMAERFYFSEVTPLNFDYPKIAADAINNWVSSKTKGLIPTIVNQAHLSPTTQMMVANALYFKSAWLHSFEPQLTHGDCFYKEGECKKVAMMDLQAELNYVFLENMRAHALELPYQGNRYSMLLVVPQDRDSGISLIRDLPYIGLPEISTRMETTNVYLSMPKFTVDYSEDMIGPLSLMRIRSLFTPSANLSGIFEENDSPHINSIYHTVHMEVDEVGTVAAAASAGMLIPLINDQVQLRVDRPFLFFIRDNELGVVLFEGKIEDPTEFVSLSPMKDKPEIVSKFKPVSIQPDSTQPTTTSTSTTASASTTTTSSTTTTTSPTTTSTTPTTTTTTTAIPPNVESSTTQAPPAPVLRKGSEQNWFTRIFSG